MDHDERIDHIDDDLRALVAAVAAGPLDASVPTCPDFTVDLLAEHVGTFCAFWTHILCEGTGRPKAPFVELAHGGEAQERAAWLAGVGSTLVTELRSTPPDTAVWTWHPPDQHAAFVARRCSHELAVHRVDAQLARGPAQPIDAALAADGIEEVLFLLLGRDTSGPPPTSATGQTLHLHGTDVEHAEWLVTLARDGPRVERAHAKGDLALRGAVSDLEMLLYQRPTVGPVERFGDDAVLEAFYDAFTFGSGLDRSA